MQIRARAKINWTLDLVGRRADGYHLLDSLMQPIALSDTLNLELAGDLSLTLTGDDLPADESNLVLRAARALKEKSGVSLGARLHLIKRIPLGAGLGGGSADAAAALKGLNELWHLGYDLPALCQIGVALGADIPFCLHDRPMRARGIGERLSPVSLDRDFPLLLIQPCAALSTRAVFAAYHDCPVPKRPDTEAALAALEKGDAGALFACGGNVLAEASAALRPEIPDARQALMDAGALYAQMTGSGSVVFGVFAHPEAAKIAQKKLQGKYPVCLLTETAR